MKKDNKIKLSILLIGLCLGMLIGMMIGGGVVMYKFIDSSTITVDMNESKILPVMLDWFETNGYLPPKEEMNQLNVTALNEALHKEEKEDG